MPNSASTHWPTLRITPADLHVQQALDRAALVPDDSGVMADTKDGIITLAGHVHTWAEHDAVAGAALMARGVIDIRDDFRSPADRHRQGAPAQRGLSGSRRPLPPTAPRHRQVPAAPVHPAAVGCQ